MWALPACVLLLALATVAADPLLLQVLRNTTFDQFQRWQPREDRDLRVIVVDIDDESLRRLGQWPWPRTRMAELVRRLTEARVASVAFDVVLPEPDRTSPAALIQDGTIPPALRDEIGRLPDHDEAFAAALSQARVALGFALTEDTPGKAHALLPKSGFVSLGQAPALSLPSFKSAMPSLEVLQRAAAGQGSISFIPDTDGVIRRVPMMASVEGRVVPSLAAEAMRLAAGEGNFVLKPSPDGSATQLWVGRQDLGVDEQGALWVHYARSRADRYVPAWEVLDRRVPPAMLENKIVLVGTSAQGLLDLRFSPLGGIVPGVEVHAQAIEQVLADQSLVRPAWLHGAEWLACLLVGAVVAAVALRRSAVVSLGVYLALTAGIGVCAWLAFTRSSLLLDPVAPALTALLVFVPTAVSRHMLSERRQRWVRQAFARYVSPNLVDHLIAHPEALELGGRRQRCSFVFADLAGFTTLMETMEPALAVEVLNEYLDRMIAIAFEHQGTLDRIVGDSIAIVFSTPVEQADHEARALRCALAMHRFAQKHLAALERRGIAFCETRLGIHSGEVTVGNFGGSTMFDYRALGDPVNTASRLEGANKHLGTLVCISEAALSGCDGAAARPIGRVMLAGRREPVMTFEPEEATLAGTAPREDYDAAYQAMVLQEDRALPLFAKLVAKYPNDPLTRLHQQRLEAGQKGDVVQLAGK